MNIVHWETFQNFTFTHSPPATSGSNTACILGMLVQSPSLLCLIPWVLMVERNCKLPPPFSFLFMSDGVTSCRIAVQAPYSHDNIYISTFIYRTSLLAFPLSTEVSWPFPVPSAEHGQSNEHVRENIEVEHSSSSFWIPCQKRVKL